MPNSTKHQPSPIDLLTDPDLVSVSVSPAAAILGIAKSTASAAYRSTGFLLDGVPVVRVGKRCVVSVFHLRAALGMPEPDRSARPAVGIERVPVGDER